MQIKRLDSIPSARRQLAVFHGEVRFIEPAWESPLAAHGLTQSSDWANASPGVCVSESEITNCYRIDLEDGGAVFFKRYTYPRHRQSRYWLRASKAQVECFGYQQLTNLGIATLRVIAFGEARSAGKLKAAYIITEGIQGSVDFAAVCQYPLA